MPKTDDVSHLVQNRAHSARVERSTGPADLLFAAGSTEGSFALAIVVVRIEVEVDVVGLSCPRDELDVGEGAVELADGGIEVGNIAAASSDDVGNLVLISYFGPQVLAVSDAKGIDAERRLRLLGIDGINLIEDDIALEDGLAVFDDIGHGKAPVNTAADLLCRPGYRARILYLCVQLQSVALRRH